MCEFQASKNDSVSAKLEFGLIDYDSILCTEGDVVPNVEEGHFNIGVINNFDLSRYTFNDFIVSSSVCITCRQVALRHSEVHVPSPFCDECSKGLALCVQCNCMVSINGI